MKSFCVLKRSILVLTLAFLQILCPLESAVAEMKNGAGNTIQSQLWNELDIVPMPKQIKLTGKTLPFDGKTKVVLVCGENPSRQSVIGYEWINDRIRERGGTVLPVVNHTAIPGDAVSVIIGTKDDNPLISKAVADGILSIGDKNPGERGYEIKISTDGKNIYLGGADPIGALYACVTFGELIYKNGNNVFWKEAVVRDWPDQISIFSLMNIFTSADVYFPKLPKTFTEAGRKEYLDGVGKYHEYLLRRKLTGVHYYNFTLKGEKFEHAPWMDLLREGIEQGKERGIGAMIYAEFPYPGLIKNYPGLVKETDKLAKGIKIHTNKWLISWSLDEARRETASNLAEYVRATGFTHVGLHDTDAGGLDDPACWSFRGEYDKKRWGDDYTAATIHIHKTYYDELKKLNPELKILSVFYPYNAYIFDDKAFLNIREQAQGKNANSESIIKMYQQKYGAFWKRLSDAFPLDDVFCVRESSRDSVINWRKFIGNERGILWWNAVGGKYWEPVFSQGPAWTPVFADNIRNIILVAYADQLGMPLNIFAIREYSWNRATPGAIDFQPFYSKFTDYWKYAETEGDIYNVVLPKVVRNIFGHQAAPYILRAVSQNIDVQQALGRVRSSTYDLLNTPDRRQWEADNAERAASALNELWDRCRESSSQMGMDEKAFRSFLIFREVLNACKWYSKAKAQLMFAENYALNNEIDKAGKAVEAAKEYVGEGASMMKRLVAERPEALKKTKVYISTERLMADNVDFGVLSNDIAKIDIAKIADGNLKNKFIMAQVEKRNKVNAFLVKDQADITIDGNLNDPVWDKAQAIDCFTVLGGKKIADAFTRVRVVRDSGNLYVSWTAFALPGKTVHENDTIDIFLDVGGAGGELFISANGNLNTSFPEKDAVRHAVRKDKDLWTGEIAIPTELLAVAGKKTQPWKINICRNCCTVGMPTEISSILPVDAANKRQADKFPELQFTDVPADIPSVSMNVKDFKLQTVTLADRIASVASFNVVIDSGMVLNKAVLSAETYGADGKLQRRRELAVFDSIYMNEEPKTLYEVEFTETAEKGGILLKLESLEGTFTRWIRYGGWDGTGTDAASYAPGIDGGQALSGECFLAGRDKILPSKSGTIEFFFKLKDNTVLKPSNYNCLVSSGWFKKSNTALSSLYLGILIYNGKIHFSINNGYQQRRSATLLALLPKAFDYQKWHHLACVLDEQGKDNDGMRIYLDGKQLFGSVKTNKEKDAANIEFYTTTPQPLQFGCLTGGYYPSQFLMDELRISTTARYREDFNVDFKPLTPDNDTSALFHFDGTLDGVDGEGIKFQSVSGINGL